MPRNPTFVWVLKMMMPSMAVMAPNAILIRPCPTDREKRTPVGFSPARFLATDLEHRGLVADRFRLAPKGLARPPLRRHVAVLQRQVIEDGTAWHPDAVTDAFERLLFAAHLPVRLHDIRNAHISPAAGLRSGRADRL